MEPVDGCIAGEIGRVEADCGRREVGREYRVIELTGDVWRAEAARDTDVKAA